MSTTTPDPSNAQPRIHFAESVTLARRTEAARLVAALASAQQALTQFIAPEMGTRYALEPGETVEDYGGEAEAPLELVCSWCGRTVHADAIYDLELSYRHTYASEIDSSDQVITFHYDSSADYDSVTFIHENCGLPVDVPEGWEFSQ